MSKDKQEDTNTGWKKFIIPGAVAVGLASCVIRVYNYLYLESAEQPKEEFAVPECLLPLFEKYGTDAIFGLIDNLKQVYQDYGLSSGDIYHSIKAYELEKVIPYNATGFCVPYIPSVLAWVGNQFISNNASAMLEGLKALAATYLGITHHLNLQDDAYAFAQDVSALGTECAELMG